MINNDTLEKLISIHKDNPLMISLIYEHLETFIKYHNAIYTMETKLKVYTPDILPAEEYRESVTELDKKRSRCHNDVIAAISMLNRLAEKENLPLLYDGTVSEERPYRRQIANAVLSYVEDIIKNRR